MKTEDTTSNDIERMATIEMVAKSPKNPNQRGRYVLTEVLGEGGMGKVYAAYDPHLQRNVAIKVVRGRDRKLQKRLQREAAVMAQVQHANVVAVHDVEFDDEGVSLVMELVRGPNLSEWLRDQTPTWQQIIRAFIQAGRGLAVAHAAGIVHRDFKPGNVLVAPDGVFKVTDFGLAKPIAVEGATGVTPASVPFTIAPTGNTQVPLAASVTVTGVVIGTFRYMAPEQQIGQKLDGRADQFSFCVALWSALFGAPPFAGSEAELLRAKLSGPPLPPTRPDSAIPSSLIDALRRGLHPDPQHRFPKMEPLLVELERALQPKRTGRIVIGALGVLGAIGLGSVALSNLEDTPTPPPEDETVAVGAPAPEAALVIEPGAKDDAKPDPSTPQVAPIDAKEPPADDTPVDLVAAFEDWEFNIRDVSARLAGASLVLSVDAAFPKPPPSNVRLRANICGLREASAADIENLEAGEVHTFKIRTNTARRPVRKRCTVRLDLIADDGTLVEPPRPRLWCYDDGKMSQGVCKSGGPLRNLFRGSGRSKDPPKDEPKTEDSEESAKPPKTRRRSSTDMKDPFAD